MLMVECSVEYWEFVRINRNDPKLAQGFINNQYITKEMQHKYMSEHHSCFRICLMDGDPCGYIGVIDNDIRICTPQKYQGQGIGKFLLSKALEIWPDAIGRVKKENMASRSLFESSGFLEVARDNEFIIYRR